MYIRLLFVGVKSSHKGHLVARLRNQNLRTVQQVDFGLLYSVGSIARWRLAERSPALLPGLSRFDLLLILHTASLNGILASLLMHPNCRTLYELYAAPLFVSGMKVLEIGPDKFPTTLQDISHRPGLEWDILGLEADPNIHVVACSEYEYPVADGSYDIIVAANVLEHVRKPWVWMRELARIVRPGGHVITINPVSWPYHEAPVDCWRVFPEGMKALVDDVGLEVVVNRCETHEPNHSGRDTPGRSMMAYGWKHKLVDRVLGWIGYPQERAYDTITIGRRPPV
jgi:SAM-dependent methyltransferase